MAKRNKDLNIPDGIFEAINRHEYDDLKTFLDNTDWYSFTPQFIIPREDIRRLVRIIKDEEVRRDVMNYLKRYASDYFRDGAQEMAIDSGGVYIESELERRTDEIMDDFKKELAFQIDLIESNGQFSGDKFSKLEKNIKDLESKLKDFQEDNKKLKDEIHFYKHPHEHGKQIPIELHNPFFHYTMEYLISQNMSRAYTMSTSYGIDISCYHWFGSKALFGYFVVRISYELELRDSGGRLNWKPFKHAIINYDELVTEARNAVAKFANNPKVRYPEKSEIVEEAIKYARDKEERMKPKKA